MKYYITRWKDVRGRYHRFYGPAFMAMNPNTLEIEGNWWLHGNKVK